MEIKHAIFDLDGTLTDSNGVWLDAVFEYIDKACDYKREDLPPIFEKEIIFGGTYEALRFLRDEMGDTRDFSDMVDIIMESVTRSYGFERPKKRGALEFLEGLKERGADICVVTATPSDLASVALEKAGLLGFIDFIISGEERKSGKEKPYIFLEAAARMNCAPSECTLFEDALYSLRTGKMLGMTVIGIEDSFCTDKARCEIKELCDMYVCDYSDIPLE